MKNIELVFVFEITLPHDMYFLKKERINIITISNKI